MLHRAASAAPSLPLPKIGSLRQAALVSVQRLQADSASPANTQSTRKRSYSESDSPNALSPSKFPPLAQRIRSSPSNPLPLSQRIRKDIQVGESEVESPEREVLRSPPFLIMNSPAPSPPCSKVIPSPAPLVFTPVPASLNCLNCESVMTPNHQCEELVSSSSLCGQASVDCGSEPPVSTLAKRPELKESQPELSDDGTPPGSPLMKRIIRPKKFCDL